MIGETLLTVSKSAFKAFFYWVKTKSIQAFRADSLVRTSRAIGSTGCTDGIFDVCLQNSSHWAFAEELLVTNGTGSKETLAAVCTTGLRAFVADVVRWTCCWIGSFLAKSEIAFFAACFGGDGGRVLGFAIWGLGYSNTYCNSEYDE